MTSYLSCSEKETGRLVFRLEFQGGAVGGRDGWDFDRWRDRPPVLRSAPQKAVADQRAQEVLGVADTLFAVEDEGILVGQSHLGLGDVQVGGHSAGAPETVFFEEFLGHIAGTLAHP